MMIGSIQLIVNLFYGEMEHLFCCLSYVTPLQYNVLLTFHRVYGVYVMYMYSYFVYQCGARATWSARCAMRLVGSRPIRQAI